MTELKHISILGGGPGGLALGYYSKKNNFPFTIYESSHRTGGNAITLDHMGFSFDSGAHRLHDKDEEVTQELIELIGEELRKIQVPSQIFHNRKFIDFPLSPLNLLNNLGFATTIKATFAFLKTKFKSGNKNENFHTFAINSYGEEIARRFLLNYSEKLWGKPCSQLSPSIAGKRMKGLTLKTLIKEAVLGSSAKTEHLDGAFYYPDTGYGTIVDKLTEYCGKNTIKTDSRVTKVFHNFRKIEAIEINGNQRIEVEEVVSTLPLSFFIKILDPQPDDSILSLADELHFRNVIVVSLLLDRDKFTENGSVYFPDLEFPFTRIYEPVNRSKQMTPPGKASVCVEIPCQTHEKIWNMDEKEISEMISSKFVEIGWMKKDDIIGSKIIRLPDAYPILELGFEKKVELVYDFLNQFENLKLSGRNGKFLYTHIHDMMRFAIEIIDSYQKHN
ncbi:MAG: FAD-dependent oxidoreductase [Candidatus Theseobacter exili]|nr:FAD-dependent oxidoreductase [Candidatus Theseobacter exili]